TRLLVVSDEKRPCTVLRHGKHDRKSAIVYAVPHRNLSELFKEELKCAGCRSAHLLRSRLTCEHEKGGTRRQHCLHHVCFPRYRLRSFSLRRIAVFPPMYNAVQTPVGVLRMPRSIASMEAPRAAFTRGRSTKP